MGAFTWACVVLAASTVYLVQRPGGDLGELLLIVLTSLGAAAVMLIGFRAWVLRSG